MPTDQEPTKPRILPRLNNPDRTGGEEVTLENIIGQAIGAASVCWENMTGAGVFDSDRARQILDEVMEAISAHAEQRDAARTCGGAVLINGDRQFGICGNPMPCAEHADADYHGSDSDPACGLCGQVILRSRQPWSVNGRNLPIHLACPDIFGRDIFSTTATPAAEPPTPERDRKADLVVEISDSVARDAEQLADMLRREGTEDDVAAAVATLAGYLADLAKDVKALAVIVAERGQS